MSRKAIMADKVQATRERTARWRDLDATFKEFAALADYQEVCRITVRPGGTYAIPSEKDGKIAQVSPQARHSLAAFLREFCNRLECPDAEHVKKAVA
jgi:hypothetical protein